MTPSTRRATLNAREQLAEGCMVWSDWTAERERDFDAAWLRAMEKPAQSRCRIRATLSSMTEARMSNP